MCERKPLLQIVNIRCGYLLTLVRWVQDYELLCLLEADTGGCVHPGLNCKDPREYRHCGFQNGKGLS